MKNYVQPGNTLTIPATADVVGGQILAVGALVGIVAGDAATGDDLDLVTEGVFTLPKVSAQAIGIGAVVYLDAANDVVTTDDEEGGNPRVGVAVTAAANPSPSVNVNVNVKLG